jgi:hypothetical protein
MKFLTDIPGLLKRHYEKVILALALVGLLGAVFFLNQMRNEENEKLDSYNTGIARRKPKPIDTTDMTSLSNAFVQATNGIALNFSQPHNLLNPVKWQQTPDGSLIKVETGRETGPMALQITRISPLNLTITLDGQSGSGVNMSVAPETNRLLRPGQKLQSFLTTNTPSERVHRTRIFTLRGFQTSPQGPLAQIELADGTVTTVATNKPFSRVEGYRADLSYPPENKKFDGARVGDRLVLANEDYIVVAISQNEVVVSARSNDRRTTIRTNAVP